MTITKMISKFKSLLFSFVLLYSHFGYSQIVPSDRLVPWESAGLQDTSTTDFIWVNVVNQGLDNFGNIANDSKMDSLINVYGSIGAIFFSHQESIFLRTR